MSHIETWALINCLARLTLMLLCAVKVYRYNHMLNLGQRLGLGIAGGSSLMTIAPIWDVYKHGTPFDNWAPLLLTSGVVLYLVSTIWRHHRHDAANRKQIRQSSAYLKGRGLL